MSEMDWLLFLAQLPATPSSLRVNVWRRLREAGAASMQNGAWILPRKAETTIFMERLLGYVRQNGASGQVFSVQGINQAVEEDIFTRFEADRGQEYHEFLEQCEAFILELNKESTGEKFTFAELEENEQNLRRLKGWLLKIQRRDFFKSEKYLPALSAYQDCVNKLKKYTRQVYAREKIDLPEEEIYTEDAEWTDQENPDGDQR